MIAKILIIDDEESIRFTLDKFLSNAGYNVTTVSDYRQALAMLDEVDFDMVFSDIVLGVGKTGIDILKNIREKGIHCPVIMITGVPNIETASDAVRLGAFDYITKPVLRDTLLHVTKIALQHKTLIDEKERYRLNLEAIFSSVKEAIITVDNELLLLEMNEAAQDICSLSRYLIGKPIGLILTCCSKKCIEFVQETIHKKQSIEVYHVECNHTLRPQQVVSITTYPLLYKRNIFSGVVLTINDETHLVERVQEVGVRQQFHSIIGKNEKMQAMYSLLENLATVQSTVLITGESGTGKELVAEALHYKGERSQKPFIKVNCSALSDNLLESELFGHVKGAFTGAIRDRIGRFQMADGGTIFLDEIGDISPRMQLQLLRVLQEKTFERVGDSSPIKVDVRIIAATCQELTEKVRLGTFREDLYYRLKVVEVNVPPLRERRDDVPLLVNHFLKKLNKRLQKEITAISSDVQKVFMEYPWPGNVRELEHVLEHALILCKQKMITIDTMPESLKEFIGTKNIRLQEIDIDDPQTILHVLEKAKWNRAEAARQLGISRSTFYRKIEELRIKDRIGQGNSSA